MFAELQPLYEYRDEILRLIADHRNSTYFPTITIVPGEPFPRYEPEYTPPANMMEALFDINSEIARVTDMAILRRELLDR